MLSDHENSEISQNLGSSSTKSGAGLYYPQNFPIFCLFYLKIHSIADSVMGYGKILLISSHKSILVKILILFIANYCIHTGISCKYMLFGMYMWYIPCLKIVNKYVLWQTLHSFSIICCVMLVSIILYIYVPLIHKTLLNLQCFASVLSFQHRAMRLCHNLLI